jgi:YD repeat-containing protein
MTSTATFIDAYSGDGRCLTYDYDDYGDLITVTLPDTTTRSYIISTPPDRHQRSRPPIPTHLIIEEDKPDGRGSQNFYDSQRRVTNQLSTAGMRSDPDSHGHVCLFQQFRLTNSFTNRHRLHARH